MVYYRNIEGKVNCKSHTVFNSLHYLSEFEGYIECYLRAFEFQLSVLEDRVLSI